MPSLLFSLAQLITANDASALEKTLDRVRNEEFEPDRLPLIIHSSMRRAAIFGHAECLRLLAPLSDIDAKLDALNWACANGKHECVQFLSSFFTSKELLHKALLFATDFGHSECLRALLAISNVEADMSAALHVAARKGHVDCIKILLPRSDPAAKSLDGRSASTLAIDNGHNEASILIEDWILAHKEALIFLDETQDNHVNHFIPKIRL